MNIYSFLPSATEIIYALGLQGQLCGVTHECDYPPQARHKPVVVESLVDTSRLSQREINKRVAESMTHGHALYRINREMLKKRKPDLIITQELCDVCSVSMRDVLKTIHETPDCRVISLTPRGLEDVLEDIITVGAACGVGDRAARLVEALRERIRNVEQKARGLERPRVLCIEWFDPVFASGHWVPEIVKICGGVDGLGREGKDSRRIAWAEVVSYDPEVVVLMPCGFSLPKTIEEVTLLQAQRGWDRINAVRNEKVYATDGSSYYSRSGPRLVDGLELMARMIHPEVFSGRLPKEACAKLGKTILVRSA